MSDDDFEPHRRYLVGLAYRMLGSVAEAEDVVQDAFVRWSGADRESIVEPRAYLSRTVSRLCLDRMKSARARRETYVGTWLPEPFVDADQTFAADLSVALLMTLERLSPLERAAFLLHDVFDMDYRDVGEVLERSDDACRQLAARAREHVREARPRFPASPDATTRLIEAFHTALLRGDVGQLAHMLAEDAVLYTDGGGKKLAALNPIYGRDKIVRFFEGVTSKRGFPTVEEVERTTINGLPGYVLRTSEGIETLAFELADDDRIVTIYIIRNPDKLRHLA